MKPLFVLLGLLCSASAAPLGITISQLGGNLSVPYILESNPDRDELSINVSARIQRNQVALPANVSVRWRATLSVQGGAQIAQTTHTTVHTVNGVHNEVVNTSFTLNPPGFLSDAVTHTLLLEVFHINDPAAPVFTLDDTEPLAYPNFGHFSGALNFGTIQTTLASFGNPPPHYLGAGRWQLTVFAGALGNGFSYGNSVNSVQITAGRTAANGALTVISGNAEIEDDDDGFEWNGWKGTKGVILISLAGIEAQSFTLQLPPGLGWRDGLSGILNPVFSSGAVPLDLDQALNPVAQATGGTFPAGREFVSDCIAVAFTPPSWTFNGSLLNLTTPGTRFLRHERYQQQITLNGKLPLSNDCYLFHLETAAAGNLEVRPGAAGGISVALGLHDGNYTTHFPPGDVGGLDSTIQITNDAVDSTASNVAAAWVHLQYNQGCPQSGGAHYQGMRLLAPALTLTPQGGLTASGNLATDAQFNGVERHLEIGLDAQLNPVHETGEFTQASFYAPGFCAPPGSNPAAFLLAEVRPASGYALGYPKTPAYAAGLGLYAGFNFFYPAGMHVHSRVGGAVPFDYEVFPRKAYARWSGVGGVIESLPGELPFQAAIYAFPISFTEWGFNFLGNEMRESFIEGQVDLSGTPADFVQRMEDVRISCCGNLESFEIPQGEEAKRLGYWTNFEIRNSSARFVTPGACDNDRACLRYASTAEINGLPGRKAGYLSFLPDGTMTLPSDPDFAASSLALIPQSGLAGQYYLWPLGDAYFNHPGDWPGFVTAAGEIETPYFNLTPIRFHTTAVPEYDDEVLVGFMHGDFLPAGDMDMSHRGFPAGDANPAAWRASSGSRPHAVAAFFGKKDAFDFPVIYDSVTRNFHSPEDKGADLIVANFQSGIDRLNAELAQIHFGAEVKGMVQMTLGNLIEAAAVFGADVISDEITTAIKGGLLSLAALLDNRLERLLQEPLDAAVNAAVVNPLAQALRQMEEATPDWGEAELDARLDQYLAKIVPLEDDPLSRAIDSLKKAEDAAAGISTVIGKVDDNLARTESALNSIVLLLNGQPGENSPLGALAGFVAQQVPLNPALGTLDPALISDGLLEDANLGWLADAREAIEKLRDIISDTRAALASGQDFADEVAAVFENGADILPVVSEARHQIRTAILAGMRGHLLDFKVEELHDVIRGAIRDRFFGSIIAINLQSILRARLGYLDTLINDAINTAMQAVIRAVLDAIREAGLLDSLEKVFENFTGVLSPVKAARINGEAITSSDRLREASIQAEVEFTLPTPIPLPMSADAMLKYQELVSKGVSPCEGPPSAVLPEVMLKASGGSAIGFGADSRVALAMKMGFDQNFVPAGFAGAFQIDSSEFNMNSIGINDFTATMALLRAGDVGEFYLAAFASGSFGAGGQSLDLEGGFFAGQSCSEAPFAFYPDFPFDLAVGGDGLLRGVAAHMSGKVPLIGASCLFNVTVGAQLGAYAFDDEVFGGKLGGSVSGEALCLLKAQGSIDLGYGYANGMHRFDGNAEAKLKLGFKPFQISKSKSFHVEYDKPVDGSGDWTVNP